MATLARRSQRSTNIWPGFVDALATLLMVIIFLLMVFVLAQFFLGEALSGRDTALQEKDKAIQTLQNQIAELAETLSLERSTNANLATELQASIIQRDDLSSALQALTLRNEDTEERVKTETQRAEDAEEKAKTMTRRAEEAGKEIGRLKQTLEDTYAIIEADKEKIEVQLRQLAILTQNVAALEALKADLEKNIAELDGKLGESKVAVAEERKISESARAQLALLNRQMAALRQQLAELSGLLEEKERLAAEQSVQITTLGKRLNSALASKVQELSRYRSEFFGRLREVLGAHKDIHVVGDRFVFQSEVLFASGSAELGAGGSNQLGRLAQSLLDIAAKIPKDINWVLRVDGHTDKVPISTGKFPSNWELSTSRAISVVKFLISRGIPPHRLAAAGFGANQPLDPRDDEIAYRRNRRIELKLTQR